MKKTVLLIVAAAAVSTCAMAGGLVTNTNHSAYMVRLLSRQASTGVDATYYNPAGLTKLSDGTVYQDGGKTITPEYPVPDINETYDTETWVIGLGVDLHF